VLQCVNKYHPKMLYFDDTVLPFVGHTDEIGLNILTHAYNTDPEMVVTGKVLEPIHKEAMLWDIERGIPDRPQEKYWQTCTCIGGWHYGDTNYKSAQTVINMLVDIVSKNGNLLLSIPVRGDGTIDDAEKRFVQEMTFWMQQNGRSIHGTRVWKSFGEGPLVDASNPLNNQGFNEGQNYSNKDVRYVVKYAQTETDRDTVFATIMRWPTDHEFTFSHLGRTSQYFSGEVESCELLGYGEVEHTLSMDGVTVQIPDTPTNPNAPVFAFTFKPGTDKALSLAELIDYCKQLSADADESVTISNTGSRNPSALGDLAYAVKVAENALALPEDQQSEATEALRKAYFTYLKVAVTPAGEPLYSGENLTVSLLDEASNFSRTAATNNNQRFGAPKYWEVSNFNIPNGGDGTKQGIDSYGGTPALMLGVWNDRGNAPASCDLSQAAIRRTVHLTPGIYYFGGLFNACYSLTDDAYMFAVSGDADGLLTSDIPDDAIAWARLNTAPNDNKTWWGITFIIKEEQDVTLGFQADLMAGSATQEFRVTKLELRRYDETTIPNQRDMTLRYLIERNKFSRQDETVTTRFGTPKYWTVENFMIPNGGDGTKNGLDRYPGYDCLMLGVWNDAEQQVGGKALLKDARIYRTLDLEPGTYSFQAQYEANYNMHAKSMMFATTELATTASLRKTAIAVKTFATAKTGDAWAELNFTIEEPQIVHIGWQVDLTYGNSTQEFRASAVRLLYEPLPEATSIHTAAQGQKQHLLYDLQGRRLQDPVHKGIYINDGKKVVMQ
ncbi:MAG: alpha-L-fucosidase, partial [Bacteroidaceae bacterium]|nr:alpha-L-fucosidase [Bacteroidaceae bacterium]